MDSSNRQLALSRFEREFQLLDCLRNNRRVKVFEIRRTSNGLPVLCMELVEGKTLRNHQLNGVVLNQAQILSLMMQVCEYLSELHGLGFVHGDVKPSNLMCLGTHNATFQIKVLDLGLSREVNQPGIGSGIAAMRRYQPAYQWIAHLYGSRVDYIAGSL